MNVEFLCHWTDLLFLKLSLLLLSLYYITKKDLSIKSLKIIIKNISCLKIKNLQWNFLPKLILDQFNNVQTAVVYAGRKRFMRC